MYAAVLFFYVREGLSIVANGATIYAFIYGFFWLRNFKRQKRIENESTEARRALDELFCVELGLDILFNGRDIDRHQAIKKTLPSALTKLLYTLLLLKKQYDLPEKINMVRDVLEIISLKETQSNPQETADAIRKALDLDNQNKLDQLKKSLLKIYEIS